MAKKFDFLHLLPNKKDDSIQVSDCIKSSHTALNLLLSIIGSVNPNHKSADLNPIICPIVDFIIDSPEATMTKDLPFFETFYSIITNNTTNKIVNNSEKSNNENKNDDDNKSNKITSPTAANLGLWEYDRQTHKIQLYSIY